MSQAVAAAVERAPARWIYTRHRKHGRERRGDLLMPGIGLGLGIWPHGGVAYDAELAVSVGAGATLSLRMDTSGGGQWEIDWGDGTVEQINSAATASHMYGPAYAGNVRVRALVEGETLTRFDSTAAGWSFTLGDLPSGLTFFQCHGSNTVSGDIANLPSGLTFFLCYGSNTVSGDIANLPTGLIEFRCTGSNTVSGDIANLPSGLTFFHCYGSNTVSGDLVDLPTGLIEFRCTGSNTISGDIANLPSSLTFFLRYGSNTISGDIANLPSSLTFFQCYGSSTVSGDLVDLPSNLVYFACTGSNTITYGGGTWYSSTMRLLRVEGASGLSSTIVDNLLIELANTVTTWTNEKSITIKGSRTAASDAAVATLNGLGVTVTISA